LTDVITRYYISAVKRRDPAPSRDPAGLDDLVAALLSLRTPEEVRAFLDDLCTPAELEAIADRWRVVPLLADDVPYREIHDRTGVSVTTIGRVARCLERGAGGYRLLARRLGLIAPDPSH
jgi:TrpR-related protein YerC/YecD